MVFTVLNWTWAFISFYLIGTAFRKISDGIFGCEIESFAGTIVAGICAVTFYATLFSIFYRVGVLATLGLLAADIVALLIWRRHIISEISSIIKDEGFRYRAALCLIIGVLAATLASSTAIHYDTYLYHAQAIQWIEKFGAVKGLGNLHVRFAYNSSFFCLQALFSWQSLIGRSLHVLNGLFCLMGIMYSVTTLKFFREKRLFTSDLLKLSCVFSCFYVYEYISSPCSDIMPMLLVYYIFIRWMELYEDGEKRAEPFAYLCLAAIIACTVKLSVAPVVILVLMPAVMLIRGKKLGQFAKYAVTGIAASVPFFVRNVILSGYLIYPFPEIDLFDFDWKVPKDVVLADRQWLGIVFTSGSMKRSFIGQFAGWYAEQADMVFRVIFLMDTIALAVFAVFLVRSIREKKNGFIMFTAAAAFAGLAYFMNSVLLVRYSSVFMLVFPCIIIGMLDERFKRGYGITVILASLCIFVNSIYGFDTFSSKWVMPADYSSFSCNMAEKQSKDGTEYTFFVPSAGDQSGYDVFPETYSSEILDHVVLRGNTLADGFRYEENVK